MRDEYAKAEEVLFDVNTQKTTSEGVRIERIKGTEGNIRERRELNLTFTL